MADLVLNWGLLGAFGTTVEQTQTVDTGGVNVTIGFEAQDEEASGVTFNAPGYVAADDPFDNQSFLKLSGQGGEEGVDATSTTTLDFSSSNVLFDDCVQNVSFRINDIDGGGNDIDPTPIAHEDIVTIRAYGPDGTEIPVSFSTGSNVTATGNTLSDGDVNFGYEDGEASTLVSVAGPVLRIEIEYANGAAGEQTVMVSDLHFATCPADGNLNPVLVDDTATTEEDTAVVVDVLGNDSDPEGDPLSVTGTSTPANGSVVINGDGTVTYTPDTGFVGTDTFDYTVTDGQGNVSSATVTVTVQDPAENLPATLVDDQAETDEDTPVVINVLSNDTDPEGDSLTVVDTSDPGNGTVVVNPDGTVTYTPNPGFSGRDSFEYTVEDGGGNYSSAVVFVQVGDPGLAPVASDDADTTDVDTPVVIAVLGNDTDPEGEALTVTGAADPANGSVVINADGTVTYTPDAGFVGTDTFDYTIADPMGNTSSATVTVVVSDPVVRDGIVSGTGGDDLIDVGYTGDPDGDRIDANDQILPGEGVDDDIVRAGDGDDTVLAGEGNDDVRGGAGDDDLRGEAGDDELYGEDGDDVIDGGSGNDTIEGGDGRDSVSGGDGNDEIDTSGPDPLIDVEIFPGLPVDSAPENDRDLVDGGAGDDLIRTGDDRDTITGGLGNDTIFSGIDDDEVYGNEGNDSIVDLQGSDFIDGGDGDDTIDAGTNTFSDYIGDDPNLPVAGYPGILTDPNTTDGLDTVFGGAGNDLISTGDDADEIDGGTGNDTIDGGIDDDTIRGGEGNDSILGQHGADSIFGDAGDDYINAGGSTYGGNEPDATDPLPENDRDFVDGGEGNDTILTGDDADTILGGAGNDVIDAGIDNDSIIGGTGDDSILGGAGDDTAIGALGDDTLIGGEGDDYLDGVVGDDLMSGGAGADTMLGGQGQDRFTDITGGDVVDGGSGPDGLRADGTPNDFDTLDLRGAAEANNPGGSLTITYTSADREDGFVDFLDADGNITSSMVFEEIENVVPCFTPGTAIATPRGERLVEDHKVGDKIITRDNGIQEICWMGHKVLSGHELARRPNLRPILIQKGALGNNLPEHDILVSPQHRILINNERTSLYFEESEVLVAAKHLTGLKGVDAVGTLGVSYVHFMFENHEVVLSNGAWTESFQPGQSVIDGLGGEQREEIYQLFPELKTQEGLKDYTAARRALKKHEAHLLVR